MKSFLANINSIRVRKSVPYAIVYEYRRNMAAPLNSVEQRANSRFFEAYMNITLIIGLVIACYYTLALSSFVFRRGLPVLVSSNSKGEARLKQSASYKISQLLSNAMSMHDTSDGRTEFLSGSAVADHVTASRFSLSNANADAVMLNYVMNGQTLEPVGGFVWTWKQVLSGQLFEREGIWLPTRMIVFQLAQLLIACMLLLVYLNLTQYAANKAAEAHSQLPDNLPQWARS